MRGLIMNAMDRRGGDDEDALRGFSKRAGNDLCNVPRLHVLFKIFGNLDSITLTATDWSGSSFYSFSLLSVLRQITGSLLSTVLIKAVVHWKTRTCWLDVLWSDEECRKEIVAAYKQANYHIGLEQELMGRNKDERWCVIRKE